MDKAKITFSFEGTDLIVQCLTQDKMKDICLKYAHKIQKDMKTLIFLYGGNLVQFELSFKEQASIIDRKYNEMKILVYKNEDNKKIDEVILSTNNIKDRVNGIKLQIQFIIKNCPENMITLQLNNINYLLNGVNDDINKVNDKIKNLTGDYSNNGMIKIFESQINKLNEKLNELKNENQLLINKNNDLQNINNDYISKIIKLESEKNQKNNKKQLNSFENSDKIMSVNFVSMDSTIYNYSLICKDTDLFVRLEERLYEDFSEYTNSETFFMAKGKRILRFKTLAENGIKNNDIIQIFTIDD